MAKSRMNQTGRSDGESRHVRLHYWLLESPAYRSLTAVARALLVELYKQFNTKNNGNLYMSVRTAAERTNVSPATAARALKELDARGFIRMNQRGSFNQKTQHATSWILTEFDYGNALATKDFMRWRPPENQKPVSTMRPTGINYETERYHP